MEIFFRIVYEADNDFSQPFYRQKAFLISVKIKYLLKKYYSTQHHSPLTLKIGEMIRIIVGSVHTDVLHFTKIILFAESVSSRLSIVLMSILDIYGVGWVWGRKYRIFTKENIFISKSAIKNFILSPI